MHEPRWYRQVILPFCYASVLFFSLLILPRIFPDSEIPFSLQRGISILQWSLTFILAGGVGHAVLRLLPEWNQELPLTLVATISVALGMGLLGALISLLGFLQILSPWTIQTVVLAMYVALGKEALTFGRSLFLGCQKALGRLTSTDGLTILFIAFSVILVTITFVNTLTPPWDYDGLMYHLLGPVQYLKVGGFYPDLGNWYVNGPFLIEMLFTIGLSIGDDVLPKLVHFTYWLLLVGATYSLGVRWDSRKTGLLASAIILGVPALPIWASFAYIDIGWSLYELLALICLLFWLQERKQSWLLLASSFCGFAMSSKYLGLIGALIIGMLFITDYIRQKRLPTLTAALSITLPAFLIAFPWYLKNVIWFQNPVYPFVWGGHAWDSVRLAQYNDYLGSFGQGNRLLDFLLLPWNVYAHNEAFGAVFNRNDIPHIFFVLSPFVLLLRNTSWTRLLLYIVALRTGIWFLGSQQIRFLLPIYPLLAILAAISLSEFSKRYIKRSSIKLLLPTLTVALIFIPIFYQVRIAQRYQSFGVLTGKISKDEFLTAAVGDFAASQFIRYSLPQSSRVIFLGNGRGYYCVPKCVPDPDHFHRARQINELSPEIPLHEWLGNQGGTHLQISLEDLDFLLQHDRNGVMREALQTVVLAVEDQCFSIGYEDRWIRIYRLDC